jgi:hypothetical protein
MLQAFGKLLLVIKKRRFNPMEYRALGRTGWQVSAISFGAWAIGSAWGKVDDKESLAALHRASTWGRFLTRLMFTWTERTIAGAIAGT